MKKTNVIILVLLVVTAVGLCIAALQKTHEAAARTQCTNNLKQIAMSIHGYNDSHRKFPSAIASPPTPEFPPEKQIGWLWLVSPYVESRMDPKFMVDIKKP